ncbi:hypothetical protein [Streptomyces sp. NPDC058751]|uniref:hypothetical protein n=1 Tax=Streptomyces sp. NPDC058751 TaxID=3346623 RepID=UPI00368291AE
MRCSTLVEFFPVILSDDPRPIVESADPAAVRIAFAAHLSDGDLVVGAAETPTWASVEAGIENPTSTQVLDGEFYHRAYLVDGHDIDCDGWVSLAKNAYVWRSNELVLHVPARSA